MADRVTIPLSRHLKGPNGLVVKELVLREPDYDEIQDLGDPYMIAVTQSKIPFQVENTEVIKAYIARCIVEPKDPALLKQMKPYDVITLKDKMLSFFQPDAPETAA
jgi:hypothetical protein